MLGIEMFFLHFFVRDIKPSLGVQLQEREDLWLSIPELKYELSSGYKKDNQLLLRSGA